MKMPGWILVFVVLTAGSVWAQSEGDPVLTVEGNAVIRVAPDLAIVRLGMVAQSPTAREAQEGVNSVANGIVSAVTGVGIDPNDVQTSRLNLTPVYSRGRPNETEVPSIIAYRATNTVTVRTDALDRLGEVIDVALDAGANQLEGVSFQLQDDLDARQAALRDAVGAARVKAEVMADALGVALVSVLSVNEGGIRMDAPVMPLMEARALSLQQDVSTPVSLGEVAVAASVTIRYRIESN